MRIGIILAAVVLSLGVVGLAMAQQAGQQPKEQTSAKTKLRAQAIELRVEVELIELEHDAARAEILELTKEIRDTESQSPEGLQQLALSFLLTDREAFGKLVEKEGPEKAGKQIGQLAEETQTKTLRDLKASRERKKKDYAKQAEELAGKRFDLADAERLYNEAR
jgi:hypothetical protein